jgi:hypothetical protein
MQKTMPEPPHTIDALALIRAIRDAQADEMQGMTSEQQIAYFRAKAQELLQKIRSVPGVEQPASLPDRA